MGKLILSRKISNWILLNFVPRENGAEEFEEVRLTEVLAVEFVLARWTVDDSVALVVVRLAAPVQTLEGLRPTLAYTRNIQK